MGASAPDGPANDLHTNVSAADCDETELEFADTPTSEGIPVTACFPRGGFVLVSIGSASNAATATEFYDVTQSRYLEPGERATLVLELPEAIPFEDEDENPLPEVIVQTRAVEDTNENGEFDFERPDFTDGHKGEDTNVKELQTTVVYPVDAPGEDC
ncbi:hypothetical protein HUG10_04705 [Halorarum halophilum]|uniref:Uncharacterized protein n=1 Tax=Halorarum halophilum TaxID=2743090 RepID=A0A7D5L2M8_9EURY|nr:hypothetical protein [Halobaculum halophilum]QLG26883.1 hypothetical protein HUG10_04705 [Halobaculum halophilum]